MRTIENRPYHSEFSTILSHEVAVNAGSVLPYNVTKILPTLYVDDYHRVCSNLTFAVPVLFESCHCLKLD